MVMPMHPSDEEAARYFEQKLLSGKIVLPCGCVWTVNFKLRNVPWLYISKPSLCLEHVEYEYPGSGWMPRTLAFAWISLPHYREVPRFGFEAFWEQASKAEGQYVYVEGDKGWPGAGEIWAICKTGVSFFVSKIKEDK